MIWSKIQRRLEALLQTGNPAVLLGIVVINLGLTLFTALVTLRDFPNSGDEYAFLLSAQLFAEGRLWVPSPEPREFFTLNHVINDGHYYGKYPPGWPLILSLGVLVNVPWLVNPLLGVLTLALMHRMAREMFSPEIALAALYATAANPFFIFNSASYYSHASCLLFMSLFAYASFRSLTAPTARLPYVVMGASLGAAFLVRPYTSVTLALPFAACLLVNAFRTIRLGMLLRGLALGLVSFGICLAAFLVYNDLQTGSFFLQPFSKYNPRDTPFGQLRQWHDMLYSNVFLPLRRLTLWIPLSVPLLVAFVLARSARRDTRAVLLLMGVLSLFAGYVFYAPYRGNSYGPRYLYEASFAVFMLIGYVAIRWKRFGIPALLLVVGLNVGAFGLATVHHAAQVRARMIVYDLATRHQLSNAVVFLRTGSGTMSRRDLARNGIHFDRSVLYVHDLGTRNTELVRAFPDRQFYVYEYDSGTETGRLTAYAR